MASEPQSAHRFYVISSIVITVAALYLARDLLIPLALAVFLTFLLAPLATRLERLGLGKIPGSLATVALAFVVIAGLGYLVTDQVIQLADRLPLYEDNIRSRMAAIQETSAHLLHRGTAPFSGFMQPADQDAFEDQAVSTGPALQDRSQVAAPRQGVPLPAAPGAVPEPQPQNSTGLAAADEPVPVRIVQPPENVLSYVRRSLPAVVGPLGMAGIIIVLTIFMLIQRRDLRDRLITLTGRGQVVLTTQAIDEISSRISRYLLMQLMVNGAYSIPLMVGLTLFGIPNAMLLGLMALFLRFIPYVGAWFTNALAVLLALTVFPGWWGPLGVLTFLVVLELIVNNAVEPWLYSMGTGISVLGVIFSAVFWAWIWGPVGLVLATPIAVLLTVVGRYIPQLEFLEILLGGRTTLEPKLRFVQRLLALDQQEAEEIAEEYREAHSLLGVYEELIVPALQLAEQERHSGRLDEKKEAFLDIAFREVIETCAVRDAAERAGRATTETPGPPPATEAAEVPWTPQNTRIICLPAGDEADELAGIMLQRLLQAEGYQAETAPVESLSSELLAEVEERSAQIVIISALPPGAMVAARYLCKRVRSRWPKIPILIGLWNAVGNVAWARERLEACGNSKVVTGYAAALTETARAAQSLQFIS